MNNEYCDFCKQAHGELHADVSFGLIKNELGMFLVIDDLNEGNKSVTNDVEYVLWAVKKYYDKEFSTDFPLSDFKIIYLDSMGIYDGIKLQEGKFLCFYPIQEKDLEEAFKKAIF